jgi:NAD(P)-dependent dehydrogenase (short-subunit alcohol dehydrogenase family)
MGSAFENRVAVVTGATGELGFAVVERLLAEGARCHVPVRSAAKTERLRRLDPARVVIAGDVDFASEDSVGSFYRGLPSLWASIHCAGGFAMAPIADSSLADYRKMMAANADTAFLCCVAAVRRMRANAPAPEGIGRIVNVAALAALDLRHSAKKSAYAASKAVVVALTATIAAELAGQGLFVNAVAPATMDTPANRAAMPTADPAAWAKVADVARSIVELASPDNRVVNGAVVPVTGRT